MIIPTGELDREGEGMISSGMGRPEGEATSADMVENDLIFFAMESTRSYPHTIIRIRRGSDA